MQFQEAWKNKEITKLEMLDKNTPLYFIGLEELIKNKETLKRFKDLEDLKYLKKAREERDKK